VNGTTPFKLHTWAIRQKEANVEITAPAAATTGGAGTVNLTFSGLAAGEKYLGLVNYAGSGLGPVNPTAVRVDVPAAQ